MENKDTFQMTYSAQEQEEIQSIRKKYVPAEADKMERLRALDASVGKKAMAVSLTVGILGTLLMGVGMSFAMSDLGTLLGALAMPVGVGVGLVGIGILICAYPLYLRTLKRERARITPEILRLTDELMK